MSEAGLRRIFILGTNIIEDIECNHRCGSVVMHDTTETVFKNEFFVFNHGANVNRQFDNQEI